MSTDFFDVVERQRACRSFADAPVSDESIERILATATFAPSAENRQPWEFVVVRDASLRERIGELTRRAWDTHGRAFSEGRLSPALLADVDGGARGGVARGPVNIVVCADTERGLPATVESSIFPAVQNILLAATALGLGSALTTITTGYRDELQSMLSLPDTVWPVAIVPLGHPARPLGKPRREPFAAHTHRDLYGLRW
jgi:nitroreductase